MAVISDPIESSNIFFQERIDNLKKELTNEIPKAKDTDLQAELSKIFAIYQEVITKSIANLNSQKNLTPELFTLLSSGVSTEPSKLMELQQKLTTINDKMNLLKVEHQKNEQLIKTLQGRITELQNLSQPSSLPQGWFDQFGKV